MEVGVFHCIQQVFLVVVFVAPDFLRRIIQIAILVGTKEYLKVKFHFTTLRIIMWLEIFCLVNINKYKNICCSIQVLKYQLRYSLKW